MMEKKLHKKDIMDRLEGFKVPWEKNKDEAFQDLLPLIDKKTSTKSLAPTGWLRAAAAVGIVLISTLLFLRFFERNLECGNGEFLTHQLPDGSLVELNSASTFTCMILGKKNKKKCKSHVKIQAILVDFLKKPEL